jgi:hypothetical protein
MVDLIRSISAASSDDVDDAAGCSGSVKGCDVDDGSNCEDDD